MVSGGDGTERGRITAAGMATEGTFEPVNGAITDRIDDAYKAKV